MADKQNDVRAQLCRGFWSTWTRISTPPRTMLDTIEEMLTPDDVQKYARVLLAKVADDTYPSLGMIRRIRDLIA